MNSVESLVRPNIKRLCPYSTARDEYVGELGVFLDANESPYPGLWNRYPDPRQRKLKEKIAPLKGVSAERIFLGNGSDEAIDLIIRIFCEPGKDNILSIEPSYGMYKVAAEINDIEFRPVMLEPDFSFNQKTFLNSVDSCSKVLFLCSPNNPSGNEIALFPQILDEIFSQFKGIVVVDEAYIDFSSRQSLLSVLDKYPRLIVMQTFSKARALAALRLGMAFASPYIISLMSMVKYPYNINESTQKLAMEALDKDISAEVREIISERISLAEKLQNFSCIEKVYPSDSNFLLVKVDDADRMYDFLVGRGIIVRNRGRLPLCGNCLRITIGLKEENIKLIDSLIEYEKSFIR